MIIDDLKKHNFNNTNFFSLSGINTFCRIVDVLDGDTLTAIIPFNNIFYKFIIRLYGIDTCEIKSKDIQIHQKGFDAKNYIIYELCKSNNLHPFDCINLSKKEIKDYFEENFVKCFICCKDFDKFGRTLAEIYTCMNADEDICQDKKKSLSDLLIDKKLAYPYFGETKMSEEEIKKYFDLE